MRKVEYDELNRRKRKKNKNKTKKREQFARTNDKTLNIEQTGSEIFIYKYIKYKTKLTVRVIFISRFTVRWLCRRLHGFSSAITFELLPKRGRSSQEERERVRE